MKKEEKEVSTDTSKPAVQVNVEVPQTNADGEGDNQDGTAPDDGPGHPPTVPTKP